MARNKSKPSAKGKAPKTKRVAGKQPAVEDEVRADTEDTASVVQSSVGDTQSNAASQAGSQADSQEDDSDQDTIIDDDAADVAAEDSQTTGRAPIAKRAKKDGKLDLDKTEEENMLEWVHGLPCLYAKADPGYKDSTKKHQLWKDGVAQLNFSTKQPHRPQYNGDDLYNWWKGMRTRYAKNLKKMKGKSGDGAKQNILTERALYI